MVSEYYLLGISMDLRSSNSSSVSNQLSVSSISVTMVLSKPARPPAPPNTRLRAKGKPSSAAKAKSKDVKNEKVHPKHAILASSESEDSDLLLGCNQT